MNRLTTAGWTLMFKWWMSKVGQQLICAIDSNIDSKPDAKENESSEQELGC